MDRAAKGRAAEDAAALFFASKGFEILARNVRVRRLEIDLLARKDELVVVVEVRSRGGGAWVGGFTSVDWRKRARIRAAGHALWRSRFEADARVERMRFDIVSVTFDERTGEPRIEHAEAAF